MPIDANIPLMGQPVRPISIQDLAFKRAQAFEQTARTADVMQQVQQRQRENQEAEAVKGVIGKYGGDLEKAMPELFQVAPTRAPAIQKSYLDNQKAGSELAKAKLEHDEKLTNFAAQHFAGPKDQAGWDGALATAKHFGIPVDKIPAQYDPAAQAQIVQKGTTIQQQIEQAKEAFAQKAKLTDQALAQTKETREATESAARLPGIQAETQQKQAAVAGQTLGATTNQAEWDAALMKAPPAIAAQLGPMWSPANREKARQLGLTAEQQTTAAQRATTEAREAAHNAVLERQGNLRINIDQARLKLEREKTGFDMSGGVSETAKAAAAGQLDPATLRAILRRSPGIIGQIKAVDPTWDEADIDNRYNTAKEFSSSSNSKAGGQVIALNTLIHHAELYQQAGEALRNGSFKPGNAVYNAIATAFGSAPPTNAALVARFLAGETGKVATGGVPAEGEIKGILGALGSDSSPEQIKNAGDKLLEIAAGRAIPLQEKAHQAKLDNVVHVIGDDAQRILQSRGFDPKTLKRAEGGPPTPATQAEFNALPKGAAFKKPNDPTIYHKQ